MYAGKETTRGMALLTVHALYKTRYALCSKCRQSIGFDCVLLLCFNHYGYPGTGYPGYSPQIKSSRTPACRSSQRSILLQAHTKHCYSRTRRSVRLFKSMHAFVVYPRGLSGLGTACANASTCTCALKNTSTGI